MEQQDRQANASTVTEISVDGGARVSARPDAIKLRLELKGVESGYDLALKSVDGKTRTLRAVMGECGVTTAAITHRFEIEEVWKDRYDEDKRRLDGYCAQHTVEVTIPLDMALLDRFLEALGRSGINPIIRVIFEVMDPKPMLAQARTDALAAATASAHGIAEQLGLRITGIRSVRYSAPNFVSPFSLQLDLPEMAAQASISMDLTLTPEDVTVRDGVTVVWLAEAA